jgi:hypothetical protein
MVTKTFDAFKGKMLKDVADQINLVAQAKHLHVNVIDPADGISSNIDVEHDRLNVHVDESFHITRFTVG